MAAVGQYVGPHRRPVTAVDASDFLVRHRAFVDDHVGCAQLTLRGETIRTDKRLARFGGKHRVMKDYFGQSRNGA